MLTGEIVSDNILTERVKKMNDIVSMMEMIMEKHKKEKQIAIKDIAEFIDDYDKNYNYPNGLSIKFCYDNGYKFIPIFYKMWEIYHHKRASGVYFVRDAETKYVKIGYSLNIPHRIMELNQSAHYKDCKFILERVILTSPTEARVLEKIMHEHYKKFHIEWELYDIKQYNDYYTNYKNITYRDKIILNHNYCMLNPINVISDYDNELNKILFKQTGLHPPTSIEGMCKYLRKNSIFLYIPIDDNELYIFLNCIREDDECEEIDEICYESIYDDYDTQLVNCKTD